MVYKIVLKDEKGKQYFYPETYRTKAEADASFEIMQENGEDVETIVEDYE